MVASFDKLLESCYLEQFELSLNVHPSILPQWRGAAPLIAAIQSDQEYTGMTVQTIAARYDRGLIIDQYDRIRIGNKNEFTLGLETGRKGGEMVIDIIDRYPNINKKAQTGQVTYTKKIEPIILEPKMYEAGQLLKLYNIHRKPPYMNFLHKKLIPIGLEIFNDDIHETDDFFYHPKTRRMFCKCQDGKFISFSHFRWTDFAKISRAVELKPTIIESNLIK